MLLHQLESLKRQHKHHKGVTTVRPAETLQACWGHEGYSSVAAKHMVEIKTFTQHAVNMVCWDICVACPWTAQSAKSWIKAGYSVPPKSPNITPYLLAISGESCIVMVCDMLSERMGFQSHWCNIHGQQIARLDRHLRTAWTDLAGKWKLRAAYIEVKPKSCTMGCLRFSQSWGLCHMGLIVESIADIFGEMF